MPTEDKDLEGVRGSEPLYTWWFNLIPALFGASGAKAPGVDGQHETADGSGAPPAVGHVAQALEMTRQLMTPLYQAFLQALLANPQPEQAFGKMVEQSISGLRNASQALAGMGRAMPPPEGAWPPGWKLLSDPMAALGDAMKPLSLNLERTYGGLADAFGLAPSRELQHAGREMLASAFAKRQAQAEYLALATGALAKGAESTMARLREMGRRGESVDSLLALVRLWARATDEAVHVAMQTPEALDASAKLLRAGMRSRQQQQRMVAIASEALNVPTRAEVDAAYREIQDLKRELRRLRKPPGPVASKPTVDAAAAPAVAKPARARTAATKSTAAAKRKNSAKVNA